MLPQLDSTAQNNADSTAWKQYTVRHEFLSVHEVKEVVYLRSSKSLEKTFRSENCNSQLPSAGIPQPFLRVIKVVAHGLFDFGVSFLVEVHVARKILKEVQNLSPVVIKCQHQYPEAGEHQLCFFFVVVV